MTIFLGSNIWILLIPRKKFPLIVALLCILIGLSALIRKSVKYYKARTETLPSRITYWKMNSLIRNCNKRT